MTNSQLRTATVFLQVQADEFYGHRAKVVRSTQNEPDTRLPNSVVVKLTLEIPKIAFKPLQPTATIRVPEALVQHPVEIVVGNPDE